MAMPTKEDLSAIIIDLVETNNAVLGITNFVNAVGDAVDLAQADPGGVPGIFALNRPIFIAELSSLAPTASNDWIPIFSSAWEASLSASTVVSGTITDPAWLVSITDQSVVLLGVPAAKTKLEEELANATAENEPAKPIAKAFIESMKALQISATGLAGTPASPVPLTLTKSLI